MAILLLCLVFCVTIILGCFVGLHLPLGFEIIERYSDA